MGNYRKFIPNFFRESSILPDLTRKGQPNMLQLKGQYCEAFCELKKAIVSPPILKLPDESKIFILETDA